MGEVYRARDPRLDRDVAIKVLPSTLAVDDESLARFEREARTASSLNHPNILTVFDIGEAEGIRYLASELVEGETLRARLSRGPVPAAEAMDIAVQMASGLAAAHASGVVHRDLKPDNVMIRRDGLVKILDFGLAKPTPSAPAVSCETQAQTIAGSIVGTVRYMSPEQARGLAVDARSDVFSFGIVLYELLSGELPFAGATNTDVLVAILERAPKPLTDGQKAVPSGLQAIVGRCLEKDATRRYESGRDILAALKAPMSGMTTAVTDRARSIAVLPFVNMSADAENEYFCDGIAEELTAALAKVTQLRVAGRTSAFSFKGRNTDLREIGRQLGVEAVLEGSVRRAGTRLRVTAELVNAADGYHLWTEHYDRDVADVFAIQDEIALAIVDALKVTLLGDEKDSLLKRATDNVEAYELCLKARFLWHQFTDESFKKAVAIYERAIALDASYAPALFGLGDCYVARNFMELPPADARARGRALLERARRADPAHAESHVVLALVQGFGDWDWDTALDSCRRGYALNPRSSHVLAVYGDILGLVGRIDDGLAMAQQAVRLDPLSPLWQSNLASVHLSGRNFDAARQTLSGLLDLAPWFWIAHLYDGVVCCALGDHAGAVPAFERAAMYSGGVSFAVAYLGFALARTGRPDDARAKLDAIRGAAVALSRPLDLAQALVLTGLEEREAAIEALQRGCDAHDSMAPMLLKRGAFDSLRPDPRYLALVSRTGLPG